MSPANSPTPDSSGLIELTIDSLSYSGGRGVGRWQGLVVFVPGTAPGDVVRARVTAQKPRFWEAELVEIIKPSPHRRQPPCPVAERCGGCSWQHVDYAEQVRQKEKILRDSLRKLEKLSPFEWRPFIAAPDEFHYRNRIQLQVQNGARGFFSKRSRDLVPVEKCWISEPALNEKIATLSDAETGTASRVELALDESGGVLVMAGPRDPEAALFSQVNRAQNEFLKSAVTAAVAGRPDWIMDLYAGSGNLTFPLADAFPAAAVVAVELSRQAVARGQARGGRVEWHAGDVARVLTKLKPRSGHGVIVLDPPRVGCDKEVIEAVIKHRPRQIVYVSCNPTTFARDGERLAARGYKLENVRGIDMFPQTEHVELIASLCAAP